MVPPSVHLIGIGGAGMSALAQYLLATGRAVSGSDVAPSAVCEALRAAGARIAYGHAAAHLGEAALVVVSDAVATGNVEHEAARRAGLPVLRRAECLDALARDRHSVFVAGSHGKSTTAAMIAGVLVAAGQDPGFVIGADVPCLGGVRARPGNGPHVVAEACEAFRNLEFYRPGLAVVTNIDDEHVNHYASRAALDAAFTAFANRAARAVVSGEDAGVARIRPALSGDVLTFGLSAACEVRATAEPAPFVVHCRDAPLGEIALRLPGDHMRRNAIAAVAACLAAGIAFERIAEGLARFTGAARRWQVLGHAGGVAVIDDYAHHPTAIAATLRTARAAFPGARIVAALQPQLHSRVLRHEAAFADSLARADRVLLLDVDGGGESGTSPGSAAIAARLSGRGTPAERLDGVGALLARAGAVLSPGDVLVAMGGAGMDGVAARLKEELARAECAPRAAPAAVAETRSPPATADGTVVDLFRRGAGRHPGLPAVIDGPRVLTYAELDRSSDGVARALAGRGLAGRPVGVALPPSCDLVVALLGIMKAGAAYLPLDPSLPPARIRFMLERAGAGAVIGPQPGVDGVPCLDFGEARAGTGPLPPGPSETAQAYLCFTSGSTGAPKGIRVRHASLSALLADIVPRLALEPGARTLLNTGTSFDVSLAEICATLAGGATLVVGDGRTTLGERLAELLDANAITHLFVTPSVLASVPARPLPALRCIVAAGEACPPHLAAAWSAGRRFFNAYGPTEATIYATIDPYAPNRALCIGTALAHVRAQVLDDDLRPVPPGEPGELCLSGPGLADGYAGDPDETARRFVQGASGLLYRTGDLAREDADGRLHFLGRTDDQVKHRGVRIELGEIEHALLRQPGVVDAAACLSLGDAPSLVGFVVMEGGMEDPAGLVERLAAWLPESALPARIVPIAAMPLTPSGKKDRHRLLTQYRPRTLARASDFAPARTPVEARLAALWRQVLGLDVEVGMFDRFPALGGDSFTALTLILAVEGEFGIAVPPGYFGRIATVPRMAVLLTDLLWHRDHAAPEAAGFRGARIYRQLLDLSAQWPGTRRDAGSLITTLGVPDAPCHLLLCCQDAVEVASLAAHLPPEICLHGLRSGHLVIDQGPESVRQLCAHYVEEIEQLEIGGVLVLAGICQGGAIAQGIAETLAARGRAVALLALIEVGRVEPYAAPVALFYAQDSFANPLRPGSTAREAIRAAFPMGFTIDLVPGSHGAACHEPAVRALADHLVRRIRPSLPAATAAASSRRPIRFDLGAAPRDGRGASEARDAEPRYRWSGSSAAASVRLPVMLQGRIAIRARLVSVTEPARLDTLVLRVDDVPLPHDLSREDDGGFVVRSVAAIRAGCPTLVFELPRVAVPAATGLDWEARPLGLAIASIAIAAAPPDDMASPEPDEPAIRAREPAYLVHLESGNLRIDPASTGGTARFRLPRGMRDVWLVSRAARPCDQGESTDGRRLGVCLFALRIEEAPGRSRGVALDDPRLGAGFHAVEEGRHRWTDGRARLPATLWEECEDDFDLEIVLHAPAWSSPDHDTERRRQARVQQDIDVVGASRLFQEDFYVRQFPEVNFVECSPARHFVERGWRLGADPGPLFGTAGYLDRYPDVAAADVNPLVHYLRKGAAEGRLGWSDFAVMRFQADLARDPDRAADTIGRGSPRFQTLARGDLVVVHAHSKGHFVFKEFQRLLVAAFRAVGTTCIVADERPVALPRKPAARFVIAPHDFYHREGGPTIETEDFIDSIPINTEQMQSVWFSHALPFLQRAPYVLDTHLQTAASLAGLGLNARFLPLGYLEGFDTFQPQAFMSDDPHIADIFPDIAGIHMWTAPFSQGSERWSGFDDLHPYVRPLKRL